MGDPGPWRRSRLRFAAAAIFTLGALVAAGAAVIGNVPGVPVWAAASAAGAAALVAAFLPQLVSALKERQETSEAREEASARLKSQLEAVRRRSADHMPVAGLGAAERDADRSALLERTVKRREPPRADTSREPDPTKSAPVIGSLGDFVDPNGGRLLVLGEGGLGKTTSLLQLGAGAAGLAEGDPSAPIPVYVELKNFDASEQGFERLFKMAANSILGMNEQGFDSLWRLGSRRLLFLLDGLNEQRGSPTACATALRELTGRAPHNYIVTSRPTAEAEALTASEEGFVVLELLPLGQREIERFLSEHGLKWLYERMDDDLRDLARNPFMLVALARSCAALPQAQLPRNMGQLYRRFIDEYVFMEREPRRGHVQYDYADVKKPVLACLASSMTRADVTVVPRDRGLEADVERELERTLEGARRVAPRRKLVPNDWGPTEFLAEVTANGILRSEGDRLEFMHESVQEYFAAVALADSPVEDVAALIPHVLWRHVDVDSPSTVLETDSSYRVPVLMLSGLLSESSQLVRALTARDPLLAARCLAAASNVDPATVSALTEEWLALLARAHERYRRVGAACLAAAGMANDLVIRRLIDVSTDDRVYEVRSAAQAALRELGVAESADYLAAKIRSPSVYDPLTRILVDHAPAHAARVLFERWRRSGASDRPSLEGALARVDRAVLVEELSGLERQGRASGDESLVSECRAALEGLPIWEVGGLITAREVRERMQTMSQEAANTLEGASDVALLEALQQTSNAYRRSAAAATLAERRQSDALPALIEAVATESIDSQTAHNVARAAYRLGGEPVIDEFLSRVWGPSRALLLRAPRTNERSDGSSLPKTVGHALKDAGMEIGGAEVEQLDRGWRIDFSQSPDVARATAEVIVVEDAGDHYEVYVLGVASKFLAGAALVADPASIFASLVRALDHEEVAVRALAATLLGGYDDRAVAPITAHLEKEDDHRVVYAALASLGRIGSPEALGTLLDAAVSARTREPTLHAGNRAHGVPPVGRAAGPVDSVGAAFEELPPSQHADRLIGQRAQREHGAARSRLLQELARLRKRRTRANRTDAGGDDDARAFLIEAALTETLPDARRAAAEALRWSPGDPGTETFAAELRSPDPVRRAAAAAALGTLQEDEPASELIAALLDENAAVQVAAASSILELRADEAFDQAESFLADTVLSGADPLVRKSAAAALEDRVAEALEARLTEWIDAGRLADAEESITRLQANMELDGLTRATLWWLRGISRERQGRLSNALDDLDAAVGDFDEIPDLHASRARVLAALDRFDDAVAAQRRAVELTAENADAYVNLGWYTYLAEDFDESIRASQRALELDSANAIAAFNLVLSYLAKGKERQARSAHTDALEVARAGPPDELEGVLESARRDLEDLRDRRPALTAIIDELEADLNLRAS